MENYTLKSTYDYCLPENLIAQEPVEPRDASKMLVFKGNNQDKNYEYKNEQEIKLNIEHKHFYDLPLYLKKGDVLVINNTKVLPARLFGYKKETGAKIEILLQKRIHLDLWEIIAKPVKRLKIGTMIIFNEELSGEITEKGEYGECKIKFMYKKINNKTFEEILERVGTVPLPPYIHKKLNNVDRYQTVYSKIKGSSAAPTAGLHFTPQLIEKIKGMGVIIVEILLHVGLGTFRPVKEDNILDHKMHSEYISITKEVAEEINKAKEEGRRIIAVGTTSVRALESMAEIISINGKEKVTLKSGEKYTNIFIYPPYNFKIIDGLITNFHLPQSTLLMLISAFIGINNIKEIYKVAIENKYRFFSFGDCCLFLR